MIALGDLTKLKSTNVRVARMFTAVIAPFAPHIAEEMYHRMGGEGSVVDMPWPEYDEKYLAEDMTKYPVSFNGKVRFTLEVPAGTGREDVQEMALNSPQGAKWLDGKTPRKVIVVPGKIVNIVI